MIYLRLFRVDPEKKFIEYKVHEFKDEHKEEDLEYLLESNPDSILNEEILIIGRQVSTNLNTYIDLLGLDRVGNTAIIELKRDRTPRDTIAQVLEYASWIELLDYNQLEKIFQEYTENEDETLSDYHRTFFNLEEGEVVNYNKDQHIIVVGLNITREIRQQATFLNRKGLPTTCVEFNYFQTESGETLLSTDVVIGRDQKRPDTLSIGKRTPTNKQAFLESVNEISRSFFDSLLSKAEISGFPIHWGSVGFSINVELGGKHVSFCEGYPQKGTRENPIVYAIFSYIEKKIENPDKIIELFKTRFIETQQFVSSGKNLKWVIDKKVNSDVADMITNLYFEFANAIKNCRLKEQ